MDMIFLQIETTISIPGKKEFLYIDFIGFVGNIEKVDETSNV